MGLIGIDLSLTSSGISIGGKTQVINSSSLRGAERLHSVSNKILTICKEQNIKCAIIEGYSFASRNSQAHSIGELGGCVRMRLWENSIPYVEIPPTSRAKFATGRGNAGKTEVISAISAKTGLHFSGSGADDECDAWILEQMALVVLGLSEYDWPAKNKEGLDKIDWEPLKKLSGEFVEYQA